MPKGAHRSPHWNNARSGPRTFGTKYLETTGKQVLSVAICDRCKFKFPYEELQPDPNFPGLRVCSADTDWRDPYRLPARQTETITLRHPRPDEPLVVPQDNNILNNDYWAVPLADTTNNPPLVGQPQDTEVDPSTEQTIQRNLYEF